MRHLLALLLILNLAACKLEIAVPAGGSVISSSGLYDCAANETCTLVVDHPWFADEFAATRKPGYFFSHWDDADNSLCGGSHATTCTPFDTSFYRGRPDLLEWLVYDVSYQLRPVFIATSDPAEGSPIWRIESEHRLINYPVEGDSAEALLASLKSDTNPLDISASSGSKPIGFSTSFVSREYSLPTNDQVSTGESMTSQSAAAVSCDINSGVINIIYETTLPQLTESAGQSAELKDNWTRFQADVQTHEAGHSAINREHFQQLLADYEALNNPGCEELDAELAALFQARKIIIEQAHAQYHLDVGASTSFAEYFVE